MPIPDRILNLLAEHSASVTLSATSMGGTLGLAAGAIPVPAGLPGWLPYATSILGPVLMFLGHRLLSAWAVRKRSLAAAKRRRALALRNDNNPANDAEAEKLEDEADADDANADALEAVGRKG